MNTRILTFSMLFAIVAGFPAAFACTNLIVTKGASSDGSVMITYAADSHTRYGAISFYPAADHQPGTRCEIYHYENGKLLGTIPEAAQTYSVIQFMNEHQVAIGETTFGGLDSLSSQPGAIMDYGSLMRVGLQRSKTAREVIRVMTDLVARYGYASGGESFSISDAEEAWIMEIIGKGRYEKGAVWVARKVPDGYAANRLPLWVKPDSPITLQQMMAAMRDHYEDTPLDMRHDLGAGPYMLPYRWRPMEFKVDSATYLCERAIATQQTGYSFVAQSRNWLPSPIGGVFWFGVDDADGCVYAPMYCGIKNVPESFAWGNGSMISWSGNSAFWTFNQVNNWAYTRYNMIHPEIEEYQEKLEKQFIDELSVTDKQAASLYPLDEKKARDYLTAYSVYTGDKLVADWKEFYRYLFMRYMDGNLKAAEGRKLLDNGNGKNIPKRPLHSGYGKNWERIMIQGTGDRLRVPAL